MNIPKGKLLLTFIYLLNKNTLSVSFNESKNIKGPILLISATKGEIAPTTPMSNKDKCKNKKTRI